MNSLLKSWCCVLLGGFPLAAFCQIIPEQDSVYRGNAGGLAVEHKQNSAKGTIDHFVSFYPINTDPYVRYSTPMYSKEKILFEASPDVRISFLNNIYEGLEDHKKHTRAYYLHFRPVLRMYNENSKPVKTPSTPILLGTQHLWIQARGEAQELRYKFRMYAFSLESGHYSNGQNQGAFTDKYEDGSPESEAIYNTIGPKTNLSEILNRKSGNFSTNLTELKGSIRFLKTDPAYRIIRSHKVTLGATHYHNRLLFLFDLGGYSPNDIKIYGRWLTHYEYEFSNTPASWNGMRYSIAEHVEIIHGAHPWVEPFRLDTRFTLFPFKRMNDFGFVINYIWGHDNYNYRFVDHGSQFGVGLSWSVFPPFKLNKPYR